MLKYNFGKFYTLFPTLKILHNSLMISFIITFCFLMNDNYACEETFDLPDAKIMRWELPRGKTLIYIGTHHTTQVNCSLHLIIEKIFKEEKPDLYIMEGFSSDREGLSPVRLQEKSTKICEKEGNCGENLYGAYLATQRKIPFLGADPTEDSYIEPLMAKGYTIKDIVFFLLCQQIPYFHRDGDFETHSIKVTHMNFELFFDKFIQNQIPQWLKRDITSLSSKDFFFWYEKNFRKTFAFNAWAWPEGTQFTAPFNKDDSFITQKISWHIQKIRDKFIFNKIKDSISDYSKIIVIYGIYHLYAQYDFLVMRFGEPTSQENINLPDIPKIKLSNIPKTKLK